jgi:hypothetical protein
VTAKRWFHYAQNNSGGYMHRNAEKGIGENVWIEADNALQANAIAERIGLYWHGVDDARDCPCCGNRWAKADDDEALFHHDVKGYWTTDAFVHYANGRVVKLHHVEDAEE